MGSLALIIVLLLQLAVAVGRVLLVLPARTEGGLEGGGAALVGRGVRVAPGPHLDPPPRQLAVLLRRVEVLALNIVMHLCITVNFFKKLIPQIKSIDLIGPSRKF